MTHENYQNYHCDPTTIWIGNPWCRRGDALQPDPCRDFWKPKRNSSGPKLLHARTRLLRSCEEGWGGVHVELHGISALTRPGRLRCNNASRRQSVCVHPLLAGRVVVSRPFSQRAPTHSLPSDTSSPSPRPSARTRATPYVYVRKAHYVCTCVDEKRRSCGGSKR